MNGDEIRAARERRGWSQQQVANVVGVSLRTVGNWERGATIPRNRAARVRDVLGLDEPGKGNALADVPDVALLAELLRRAVGREGG